jgi:hypothetical protein
MQKNTATKFFRLQVGDRFYKASDRGRKVYEVVEAEKKVTSFRTYSYWAVADGSDELTAFKGDTSVVFLRHNPNVPVKPRRHRIRASQEYYLMAHKMI